MSTVDQRRGLGPATFTPNPSYDPDALGKWCLTCERVLRAADCEGLTCDDCLADAVEARDDARCAACGTPGGRTLCEGCRVRDERHAPNGGGAGDLTTRGPNYRPDTRFEVSA